MGRSAGRLRVPGLCDQPASVGSCREGHGVSGAKSDAGDAHVLADLVRTHSHQLRTVAGDSEQASAVKVLTRMHQTLIWDRTRHVLRLRSSLREYFPAALEAYEDLASPDVLELLTKAPEPEIAGRLTRAQIIAALARARRRDREAKTTAIMDALAPSTLTSRRLSRPPTARRSARWPPSSRPQMSRSQRSKVRSRPILVSTRTLRFTSASPDWGPSWAPGCSRSSATTQSLRRRPSPQELRRHQPHHPSLG